MRTACVDGFEETFEVEPGGTLCIDLARGAVEVSSHDSKQVRIQAYARGWAAWTFDFDLARVGNDVRLTGDILGWVFWPLGPRVHVRAWVPRQYSVTVQTRGGRIDLSNLAGCIFAETSGGAIELSGATGTVELHTSGGSMHIAGVNGALHAETSGGNVDIDTVTGDVLAGTSGGRIDITRATGRVEARTSGGRIDLSEIGGPVDATTSGGGIITTFTGAPAGTLETSGGSIEICFPQSAGADLDAQTRGGRIDVAHPLAVRGTRDPQHIVGTINAGGAPLRLRTSGGHISVRPL